MMAGHGDEDRAVGGPARHIPVLLQEVVAALEASGRARSIRVIAHELTVPTRAGLASGAIDVVLDQNPDGEIREVIGAARSLALSTPRPLASDPIEIGIFLRDNLR